MDSYSEAVWNISFIKSVHLLKCILFSPLLKYELKITMNAFQFISRAFRPMVIWVYYFFFLYKTRGKLKLWRYEML